MSVKERILSIKLLEKVKKRPEFAKDIGLNVTMKNKKQSSIKRQEVL